MPEAGRAIIQHQVSIGGKALPWADRAAFAELMLAWEMRSHKEALGANGPVIFDRGVPDVIGYLRLCGLPAPEHVRKAAELCRYNHRIFIAPHWPEIYAHDAERKQTPAEAEATYRSMAEVYGELGYEPIALPLAPVQERVKFVLAELARS